MRLCHDLDRHRDEAVLNLAMNLIRSVVASGTASKKTASSCTASMLKQLESVERKMDNRFQQQMDNVASLGREEEEVRTSVTFGKVDTSVGPMMVVREVIKVLYIGGILWGVVTHW